MLWEAARMPLLLIAFNLVGFKKRLLGKTNCVFIGADLLVIDEKPLREGITFLVVGRKPPGVGSECTL